MYNEEVITFDKGWKRIKLEFMDKIESNLETSEPTSREEKPIKLKPNEYITYYKLVYDMCTQKDSNHSELLYNHLGQALIEYIKTKMCSALHSFKGDESDFVELLYRHWVKYKSYLSVLRGIFSYLDRFYVQIALQPTIYEYGMAIFQKHVFEPYKPRLKTYLLELLDEKRAGNDVNDTHVSAIIEMYNKLDSTLGMQYKDELEPVILQRCSEYYNKIGPVWISDLSLLDYVYITQYCIQDELAYCENFLNASTRNALEKTISTSLLLSQRDKIEDKLTDLNALFESYQLKDLKLVYSLIHDLGNVVEGISNIFKDFIQGNIKEDSMEDIITVYNKYLHLIKFSFDDDSHLLSVYKGIFKSHANNPKFLNKLLSHFHKHLVSSSEKGASEAADSQAPENSGPKTGIDKYVNAYNLLEDRNEFIANYKMKLCFRLLTGRSDLELEREVLKKLSCDDNLSFMMKMLEDVEKSAQLYSNYVDEDPNIPYNIKELDFQMLKYRSSRKKEMSKLGRIMAVSNMYWPIHPGEDYEGIILNRAFADILKEFQDYYKRTYKFKRFQYSYKYSQVELTYHGPGPAGEPGVAVEKRVLCNMLQASLILLFNKNSRLAVNEVLRLLNIKYEHLIQIVESSQDFFTQHDDMLMINYDFVNKTPEIDLMSGFYAPLLNSSIKSRDSKSEGGLLEKYNAIDSIIVRVMKKYKRLNLKVFLGILNTHLNTMPLTADTNHQVVMARIKKLVDRDYLEEVDEELVYIP